MREAIDGLLDCQLDGLFKLKSLLVCDTPDNEKLLFVEAYKQVVRPVESISVNLCVGSYSSE